MLEKSSDKQWWTAKRWQQIVAVAKYVLWVALCFIGVQLLVALVAGLLIHMGGMSVALSQNMKIIVIGLLTYVAMVAVLLLLPRVLWRERTSLKTLGLDRLLKWSDIGLGIAGIVAAFGGSIVIMLVAQYLMPWVNVEQVQNVGVTALNSGSELVLAFVLFVIVGPIVEETIFRGFLYGNLRKLGLRFWPTTLIVSALFALAHWQWNVALDVFVLSIIMCLLRAKTGSIWVAIIMHMLKNGIAFYLTFIYVIVNTLQ